MNARAVQTYLDGHFKNVQGWCLPQLWQVINPLANELHAKGIRNPIAEIGVYHGKFFIGLAITMGARRNYAIDVFSMQQFNLDKAGRGNLDIFLTNASRAGLDFGAVVALERDSTAIRSEESDRICAETGGFSMFSVDGCHLVEHTVNDTRIAMRMTVPEGLIFVDDYNNPNWPGVQEGISRMFFFETPVFVPLIVTCNKLILCHISHHAAYLDAVRASLKAEFPQTGVKLVRRFGYDTLTVSPRFDVSG
jgi:hypothetical protein